MATDTSLDPNLDRDKILDLIKEIGQHERHFNNLCGTYKAMTSTWLLAVFGGIGSVLANRIEPWLLYTAMIGFLGSIGILLLWIIDLRVYQQLLNAAFTEGLKFENENKWLPRIRNNMIDTIETGSVSVNISWFYVLGVCGPLLIFNFSISAYLLLNVGLISSALSIVVAGVVVFYLAFRIRFKSREQSIRQLKFEVAEKVRKSDRRMLFFAGAPLYLMLYAVICLTMWPATLKSDLQTLTLKADYDYLAPDGLEIRLLPATTRGGLSHCVLPPQGVSKAVEHRTVEEIWYVLEGTGEIWRRKGEESATMKLFAGVSVTIPVHTQFQFRNTGSDSLKILLVTMPPWPGKEEAVDVDGHWNAEL